MKRKRTAKGVSDPLTRDCPACGANKREGCKTLGKGGTPLPLVPIASRLVHADRIEGASDAQG